MPLPLAMMIPFMGIQSAVMAKQFGENFQYGKRRISAMSNEEFNKLTPAILQENANAELKAMIPTMEASIKDMRNFQAFIVKEFMEMLNDLISRGLGNIFGDDIITSVEHFLHGHGGGHGEKVPGTDLDLPLPKPIDPIVPPTPITPTGPGSPSPHVEQKYRVYDTITKKPATSHHAGAQRRKWTNEKFVTEKEFRMLVKIWADTLVKAKRGTSNYYNIAAKWKEALDWGRQQKLYVTSG